MNLGQIKAALAKFPEDMDTAEALFMYASGGERMVDIISAIGLTPIGNTAHVAIVGMTEIERVKQTTGELPKIGELSPGGPSCREGDEWKQG